MANIKQTILIRKDLNFPIGLLASQCAHLHFENIRQKICENNLLDGKLSLEFDYDTREWINNPYIYIHGVPNLEVLQYFAATAKSVGNIPVTWWRDTVYIDISETQRKAFPKIEIGITLGPCDSDKIKAVIGDLPLL